MPRNANLRDSVFSQRANWGSHLIKPGGLAGIKTAPLQIRAEGRLFWRLETFEVLDTSKVLRGVSAISSGSRANLSPHT